jgi:uncharacterized protein YkwD
MTFRVFCAVLAFGLLTSTSQAWAGRACNLPADVERQIAEIGQILNAERRSRGLRALSPSNKLQRAAMRQACDMATNGVASHTGSDGSSLRTRMRAAGHCTRLAAENIAWGQRSPSSAMNWWMNSSKHRQNILMQGVTAYGIAVAHPGPGVGGGPRWVMVLARAC